MPRNRLSFLASKCPPWLKGPPPVHLCPQLSDEDRLWTARLYYPDRFHTFAAQGDGAGTKIVICRYERTDIHLGLGPELLTYRALRPGQRRFHPR
jgi:hypothetical protein